MNQGIHEWEIKISKYATSLASNSRICDAFGVTNKIDLCYKENHDIITKDVFVFYSANLKKRMVLNVYWIVIG